MYYYYFAQSIDIASKSFTATARNREKLLWWINHTRLILLKDIHKTRMHMSDTQIHLLESWQRWTFSLVDLLLGNKCFAMSPNVVVDNGPVHWQGAERWVSAVASVVDWQPLSSSTPTVTTAYHNLFLEEDYIL